MNAFPPAHGVPTLTEVIDINDFVNEAPSSLLADPGSNDTATVSSAFERASESTMTERILGDVMNQVESVFEHRLREAMTPALTALASSVVLQMRAELAPVLREMVAVAVAREMSR